MKRGMWLVILVTGTAWLATPGCGGSESGRNRTLIMDCAEINVCGGQIQDYNSFNPFAPAAASRTGWNFAYEPLYYYNAFVDKDNLIPWIATGHEYNDNYTELTVHLRAGVTWSDGQPWTAHDVVFTLIMLKDHVPELLYSTDMATWIESAEALDDLTVIIRLTAPNPRFLFTYLTNNFGLGIPIVPRHVWMGEDPGTFDNFDLERGWPVVSAPYRLTHSSPAQRIWELRDDWWAAQTGFQKLPRVERLIYLPYMDETKRVQNLIANNMDTSLDLRPPNIRTAIERNPNITTWTGRETPYGYLDFWPVSLGFNNLEPPFDDPEIRWAINFAIDRDQLVEVGWQGAGAKTLLPLPDFPPMRRFTDQVQDLLEKYPVGTHDPSRTTEILRRKGWQRDGRFWKKDGKTFKILIDIAPIFQDLAPVLKAQLSRAGFDTNFRMTQDFITRVTQGDARTYLNGHGGSVRDPHYTLSLYHSRHVRPTGTFAQYAWRWSNPAFDAVVDEMGRTAPDDPKLVAQFREAMEIWLAELPSVPLVQWYHRIAHNETYWRNWPSAENPYIHSAYWHRTWGLVLLNLEPAG